jgi:hypothetical protein
MIFKKFLDWIPDNMPLSTKAEVVVSDCGSVIKRLMYLRWNEKNKGYSLMKEHVYSQGTNRGKSRLEDGNYFCCKIRDKTYSSHVIVAKAFIPNPMNKSQVNHKDGNKQNNHYLNLEWVTNEENMRHAIKKGLIKPTPQKFSDESIEELYFRMRAENIKARDVKRFFGVTYETIMARFGRSYESSVRSK